MFVCAYVCVCVCGGRCRASPQDVQLNGGTDASGALGSHDLSDPWVSLSTLSLPRAASTAILKALSLQPPPGPTYPHTNLRGTSGETAGVAR